MMRKIILPVLLAGSFYAQATFVPVSLTGFNHDGIANGVGSASTSTTLAVDQSDWNLVAPDFKAVSGNSAPTAALPANGLINSAATAGLTYQLASYTGSNDLILSAANAPATLTFGTVCRGNLYVLGFTGNGPTTADIRVNFADNTTEVFNGVSFNDWYGGTGFAIQGIGRVQRVSNTLEAPAGDPRMYEKKLTLNIANAGKIISSITITKASATGVLNIMAVSVCQSPVVSVEPVDKVICKDWNAFFQVQATNVDTYQWQVDAGSGFTNVSNTAIYAGATTGMLNITQTPASYNGYKYRCVMKSTCGSTVYSKEVILTVTPQVDNIAGPATIDMCKDGPGTVTITHSGNAASYKWQVKTQLTGSYVDLPNAFPYSGVNTAQLDIAKAPDSLKNAVLRCIVTGDCNVETSQDIAVNMSSSAYISQSPVDQHIQPYTNAKFDVKVAGSNLYELYWQSSANGVDYVNINDNSLYTGTKAIAVAVLNVQPQLDGLNLRCILKSTNPMCGGLRDTSKAAKIIIDFPNSVAQQVNEATFNVYPNPFTGSALFVAVPVAQVSQEADINVTDVLGRVVYSQKMVLSPLNKISLPANILPGNYHLRISSGDVYYSSGIIKE